MSATHKLEVLGTKGDVATLRITIVNEDEAGIPLFRTAIASMLFDSIDAAEEAGHDVPASAKKLFTDEPEDEDEASKIVAEVVLKAVESGKVRAQHPAQGVRFARKGKKPACAVAVEVRAAKAGLFRHLRPGLVWEAAPLFPEMEEDWPEDDDA